ncbi:YdgH/BhsA/McbA-like domain containing protein [Moellerella wisconsensis]|uniref:multiple stress resistance protein BhsA n=1 Tax=Moellerella wisconsensis TaxID=158849 RepID=UPI00307659BC
MKNTTLIAATLALTTLSFGTMAATEVQNSNQAPVGVVSVSGASTLDDLTVQLAKKADEAGATSFRVVAASGENQMNGIAQIYK